MFFRTKYSVAITMSSNSYCQDVLSKVLKMIALVIFVNRIAYFIEPAIYCLIGGDKGRAGLFFPCYFLRKMVGMKGNGATTKVVSLLYSLVNTDVSILEV